MYHVRFRRVNGRLKPIRAEKVHSTKPLYYAKRIRVKNPYKISLMHSKIPMRLCIFIDAKQVIGTTVAPSDINSTFALNYSFEMFDEMDVVVSAAEQVKIYFCYYYIIGRRLTNRERFLMKRDYLDRIDYLVKDMI